MQCTYVCNIIYSN
uniref:Uncharacterized protein n=1 Tax=Anguilla anguilla TaxID=7936 RepID=A0A0E9UCI2_ANGAN